jgi:hypothetical protein
MKYMESGGYQKQDLMRLTLGLTLVLLLAFWLTNFAMYFGRMGLHPRSVVAYYNGSEEDFRPARSGASMLETSHTHLPMMGMVLLFLTHLTIFIPAPKTAKVTLILTTFACAVLDESAGWLVRFVSPAWAPLKVLGFLGLQLSILVLLAALAAFLWRGARVAASAGSASPAPGRRRRARVAA